MTDAQVLELMANLRRDERRLWWALWSALRDDKTRMETLHAEH